MIRGHWRGSRTSLPGLRWDHSGACEATETTNEMCKVHEHASLIVKISSALLIILIGRHCYLDGSVSYRVGSPTRCAPSFHVRSRIVTSQRTKPQWVPFPFRAVARATRDWME